MNNMYQKSKFHYDKEGRCSTHESKTMDAIQIVHVLQFSLYWIVLLRGSPELEYWLNYLYLHDYTLTSKDIWFKYQIYILNMFPSINLLNYKNS